jgi:hypothetical protein
MNNQKQFDVQYDRCIRGATVDVSGGDFTETEASYLMGAAKEYTREGEFFELYEADEKAACQAYKRAESLERFAASIRASLRGPHLRIK